MPEAGESKTLWVGGYSLKAGASLYIAGALLVATAAVINWYVIPYIRRLVLYAFIGEILTRYIGIITLVSSIIGAVGVLLILTPLILYGVNEYSVTEESVFCRSFSLKGVKTQTIPRATNLKVVLKQGLLGRLLNYGDVVLVSDSSVVVLSGVENPSEVVKVISAEKVSA